VGVVAVWFQNLAAANGSDVLLARGSWPICEGELVAWCAVVTLGPAVLDTEGRISPDGWFPDHVRLGTVEPHLSDDPDRSYTCAHPRPDDAD
jgi:hypothetical protein